MPEGATKAAEPVFYADGHAGMEAGPLRGVVGRLLRKDAPKARLVLSVDLIGQAVSVEVDAADVKPY